jgi:hypothetical protein
VGLATRWRYSRRALGSGRLRCDGLGAEADLALCGGVDSTAGSVRDWAGGAASAGSRAGSGWLTNSVVVAAVAASRCSAVCVADSAPFVGADGDREGVCPER